VTTLGLGESISAAILCDETIRQQKKDGTPFAKAVTIAGSFLALKWMRAQRTWPVIPERRSAKVWMDCAQIG